MALCGCVCQNSIMTRLISQAALMSSDYSGAAWHKKVLLSLQARLSPPSDVPCTFSQNAFRRQLLLLSFIEDISQQGLAQSRADLLAYVEHSRRWDGQVNSARPLVMAFSHAAVPAFGLTQQHILGWEILQNWHDNDPTPWPDKVATDPDHAFWSMCFAGMQLFINMSSPAHLNLKTEIWAITFFSLSTRANALIWWPVTRPRDTVFVQRSVVGSKHTMGWITPLNLGGIRRARLNGGNTV